MLLVGVDVGGTKVKLGIIRDNQLIKKISLSTNAFDIVRQIVNGVHELVGSIGLTINDVDGIGVGFPGMIVNNMVIDSPNIGLKNFNLQEYLSQEFGIPVIVKNDAEMATLAEHKFGAGEGCDNMVLVTLGTGVGGGIIVNDALYTGAGGAGEFGHMTLEKNGRKCTCGRMGCAEQYISLAALDRLAKEMKAKYPRSIILEDRDNHISAAEILRAYKKNDAAAIEVFNKFVYDLSSFLMDLCNIFRPNRIIVGGGITAAPEFILKADNALKTLVHSFQNAPKVDVKPATLGNDAGILGAAVCFDGYIFPEKEVVNEPESVVSAVEMRAVEELFTPVAEAEAKIEMSEMSEEHSTIQSPVVNDIISEAIVENIENNSIADTATEGSESVENIEEGESSVSAEVINQVSNLAASMEDDLVSEDTVFSSYIDETPVVEEDEYDEFANYKPLGMSLDNDGQDAEVTENAYDVFEIGQERELSEKSDNQDIIDSMENMGDSADDEAMPDEDLDNIEYSSELMAKVNNLLKRN